MNKGNRNSGNAANLNRDETMTQYDRDIQTAIDGTIANLKSAYAKRQEIFNKGSWTREEMQTANDTILALDAEIKNLRG
jgi:multidrug resistance efflux pump